jgi:cystathionine gamma-synthase
MHQLYQLGVSIPSDQPHALSVSLPTWKQVVGWASGDLAVIDQMATGYPRFFIHRTIQKVLQPIGVWAVF